MSMRAHTIFTIFVNYPSSEVILVYVKFRLIEK